MSRFNSPQEVLDFANRAAADDHRRHAEKGHDLNPFATEGARNTWQEGFDNMPPKPWQPSHDFDTIYQRGRAAARIIEAQQASNKEQK